MKTASDDRVPACVEFSTLFQHPLLEDSDTPGSKGNHVSSLLQRQASKLCMNCPLQAECLTDAITKHDVSGFVAGTTAGQRTEIRAILGVAVDDDDLDAYTGTNDRGRFNGAEIHRLRQAAPTASLRTIATRVGCSLSTVKRHLRRIERDGAPSRQVSSISPAQVMAAAHTVWGTDQPGAAAA